MVPNVLQLCFEQHEYLIITDPHFALDLSISIPENAFIYVNLPFSKCLFLSEVPEKVYLVKGLYFPNILAILFFCKEFLFLVGFCDQNTMIGNSNGLWIFFS